MFLKKAWYVACKPGEVEGRPLGRMSLMKAGNREKFKAGERAYLDPWPMTKGQKRTLLARDLNRCIELGGNIYFLVKIGATDGISVQKMVGSMTGMTEQASAQMMLAGGRSPEGSRYLHEQQHPQPQQPQPPSRQPGKEG